MGWPEAVQAAGPICTGTAHYIPLCGSTCFRTGATTIFTAYIYRFSATFVLLQHVDDLCLAKLFLFISAV